jgi:hypothetical protein
VLTEVQDVVVHCVAAIASVGVGAVAPKLMPANVIVPPSVVGIFAGTGLLSTGVSYEKIVIIVKKLFAA